MKKDIKPFLFFSIIASLLVGHLANRTALIFEGLTGNLVENINAAIDAIIPALQNNPFMIGTSKTALISGAIGAACVWLIFLYNVFGAKNFMRGSEHGSARWGTAKDIKPLTDREPDMNIPLSATEQISVRKVKDFEADRNKNIVVVGGSGSGKTYSEIKPSLMQLHSSYVITDPKGTILPETGYLFTNNGYTVRSFNTIDFSKSLHYNPLAYIHKEKDILKVVTVLMENTNGEGTGSGEKFWKDCEKLLYTALIAYLWYEAPPEDQNIPMMIEMLDMCKVKEDDEDYQSPIDIMFEDLEKEKPNCLAVKQYKKFKQAAGKTLKSILISCAARLAPFDIDELREVMMYDELQLDELGDRKTAFFVIMSDTDSKQHLGLDIAMPGGTPINACNAGTIVTGSDASGWGNYIKVVAADGSYTLYGHMSGFAVANGQTVNPGDVIGYVGTTGASTGNHLHLEYHDKDNRNLNPLIFTECEKPTP